MLFMEGKYRQFMTLNIIFEEKKAKCDTSFKYAIHILFHVAFPLVVTYSQFIWTKILNSYISTSQLSWWPWNTSLVKKPPIPFKNWEDMVYAKGNNQQNNSLFKICGIRLLVLYIFSRLYFQHENYIILKNSNYYSLRTLRTCFIFLRTFFKIVILSYIFWYMLYGCH